MDPVKSRSSDAAYRRQKQIETILYENLQRHPYASISISELCRQAGISRVAFYHYYRDKEDCLCALIDRIIQDTMYQVTTKIPDNASALDAATILMEAWREQKVYWDIIVQNNLLHHVIMRSMHNMMGESRAVLQLLNAPELPSDMDILCCYLTSQITLILQWYFRGFDTPAREMAKKYLHLTNTPMIPMSEED